MPPTARNWASALAKVMYGVGLVSVFISMSACMFFDLVTVGRAPDGSYFKWNHGITRAISHGEYVLAVCIYILGGAGIALAAIASLYLHSIGELESVLIVGKERGPWTLLPIAGIILLMLSAVIGGLVFGRF